MYRKIEGGTIINIQGLDCCLPPVGYVWDILTDKLVYTGVYQRSDDPLEQYWERFPFPEWYKDVTKQEDDYLKKKKNDDDTVFYDKRYEEYKRQEWFRRLNGFWLMIKGKPVYLTGFYYYVLQWFRIDVGYVKFITPHLRKTYFLEYCIQDPLCFGMIDLTKRRFLKTFLIGAFIIEYITRTKMANGALQSKTGNDAKKVFQKAIVYPFRGMPRFFRPEYDMSLGVNPKTEMRFQNTNVRGKKAEDNLDKEELGSMIDWGSADPLHYDGQKIIRMGQDEWAKTIEANVFDRHEVIRYCLLDEEGRIVGKVLYSSTVEILDTEKDGVQDAAIQLWEASNQDKRGANGSTESGLYRFFQTADEGKNFDKYGEPNIEKTIQDILADRETVKNNARALAARVRKEPRTVDEAFYAGNDKCEFNAENLAREIRKLKTDPPYLRQMRFVPEKEVTKSIFPNKPDKVEIIAKAMDDKRGGWFILELPNKPNYFKRSGGYLEPMNTSMYVIGVDTTKDIITINGSKPVICVFKKSCIVDGEEMGMYPVAMWLADTRLDIHFDEQVLLACKLYGCKANYEIDARGDYYRYFSKENCQMFLAWTPKIAQNPVKRNVKIEPGQRSGDPFQLAMQLQIAKMYVDGTDNDVYNGHVHRIKYVGLLEQLLKYDHANRTPYDQCIALFMCLVDLFGEQQNPVKPMGTIRFLPYKKIALPA